MNFELKNEEKSETSNQYKKFYNDKGILIYEGHFKKNIFNGFGTLFYENESIHYKGHFKNGLFHGNGSLFKDNNIEYSGIFKKGKFHGFGIQYSSSKKILYKGNWKNGKKKGQGIVFHSNDVVMYDGLWHNNHWEGFGKFYTFEGKKIYEGNFRSSLRHGDGTYFDNSFIRYKGNWKYDFPSGYGISFFRDGKCEYEGKWKHGYRHGLGILHFTDGRPSQNGKWCNDIFLNDSKLRKQKKCEILIQNFLDTKNKNLLIKVPPRFIKHYLQNKNIFVSKFLKKDKLIQKLIQSHQINNIDQIDSFDLFGNEILEPVKGSDGQIYDLSSMEYLFQKNTDGKFLHIPYIYNHFNILVPNFPTMANGKQLYSFLKI